MRTRFYVSFAGNGSEKPKSVDVWIEGPLHLAHMPPLNDSACVALEEAARLGLTETLGGAGVVTVCSISPEYMRATRKKQMSRAWCPEFSFFDGELRPAYVQPPDMILPSVMVGSLVRAVTESRSLLGESDPPFVFPTKSPFHAVAFLHPPGDRLVRVEVSSICVQQCPMGDADWTWMIQLKVERGRETLLAGRQTLTHLMTHDDSRKPNLVYATLRDMIERVFDVCELDGLAQEPLWRCAFRNELADTMRYERDILWKCQNHRVVVSEAFPFYRQVSPIKPIHIRTPDQTNQPPVMTSIEAAESHLALMAEMRRDEAKLLWLDAQAWAARDGEPPAATHCHQHGMDRVLYACQAQPSDTCTSPAALPHLDGFLTPPAEAQAISDHIHAHRFWLAPALDAYRALVAPLVESDGCKLALSFAEYGDRDNPPTLTITLIIPDEHPRLGEFTRRELHEYLQEKWLTDQPHWLWTYHLESMLEYQTKTFAEWTNET